MKKPRLLLAPLLFLPLGVSGGTFLFTESEFMDNMMNAFGPFPDLVTHPQNYDPSTGGTVTVRVCIANGSPNQGAMEIPLRNVIDRYNLAVPVTPNIRTGADSEIASDQFDWESVALHELGHCIGLNHPNAANESCSATSGLCGAGESEYTKALPAPDTPLAGNEDLLEGDPGTDGIIGSPDDLRGDDVNLHECEIGVNNPVRRLGTVDSMSYSRDPADLPEGDNFAANADRTVGQGVYGVADTEAVMQQGTFNDETQRSLAADDIVTLRYARSGTDRVAGAGGDDYTVVLEFTNNPTQCDIAVDFDDAETGFAVCQTSASLDLSTAGNESAIIQSASVFFNNTNNWFFSATRIPLPAADQGAVANGGSTTTVNGGDTSLLANDTDQSALALGLVMSTTAFGGPDHGSVTLNADGTFEYTHNGGSATEDAFTYEVCATGEEACAHQVVEITISASGNLPPTAVNDSLTVDEGGTATTLDGGAASVIANDSDPDGGNLTVTTTPVSNPANGALTLNGDGTFEYIHDGSETTSDSFVYEVCDDGSPQECSTATVSITINPVNDPPVAVDDLATVGIGGTVTMTDAGEASLLANDSDPEGDTLTATRIVTAPTDGTATVNLDGTFEYVHTGSAEGTDSFEYEVCDSALPPACDTGLVTVTISSANLAPNAMDDSLTVSEGGTANTLDSTETSLLANDSDPNTGDTLAVTTTPVNAPSNGALTLNADGTFDYIHDGSETTTDSFEYEVCDDDASPLCSTATVAITVTPVNDPPTATQDQVRVDIGGTATMTTSGATSLLANDSDPEGDNLTVTQVLTAPTDGNATVNPDGTFSYTHTGTTEGSDSFEYEVCDDNLPPACSAGTVNVTIGNLLTFAQCARFARRVVVGFDVSIDAASEFAGTGLTFSASGLPASLSIDSATGLITGVPIAEDATNSPFAVTVSASDGTEQSFTLQVDASAEVVHYSSFEERCFGL
ncbi:MAG: Ig-like domain-containing protein [Xanthomonadales bacterium]|nr:Ig-like domain-containing protein [Xanthomonadales bacterium]